jgi:uncharacterized protein YhbP (UPF0306 family)
MPNKTPTQTELTQWRKKALTLIRRQSTMVLATSMDQTPWAAPVYYTHVAPGFYFFSSPHSVHIRQALSGSFSAAAICADGDRIEAIEGIQMSGHIAPVQKRLEQVKVTTHFLAKFPLAKPMLRGEGFAMDLSNKVCLYCFSPETVYYMDNRSGFGRRMAIELYVGKGAQRAP